ncbi:CubicO group peptidase (beta-lactamase class C family) [Mycoplana sp. BE70]|uniref:serine hydrolase domain-containing protein n=1 Tax=Mycoplana sp. BE70 TaxID=2817775 RepID=UPI002864B5B3|nr:serine hydrolase [Mycoplana sp. BE70]MDR6756656.1 CubicO group peptidase (beta-lactamase class C family) [Mycoplana sp. BE70]
MARYRRAAAKALFGGCVFLVVTGSWLIVRPPELLRVGSSYAAKIVCSNVFIARRNAAAVLDEDVQAPGHPLLRLMRQSVDYSDMTVTASLLGLFAPGYAAYREGFGCTSVPDGDFLTAREVVAEVPLPKIAAGPADQPWPAGEHGGSDPRFANILDDPALLGPGVRGVVVIHDGQLVGERYGDGFSADMPLLGWSLTKTVNAALVGRLILQGRLSPAQALLFPEWQADARGKITVADLLAMQSGLVFGEDYGDVTDVTRMLFLEPNMARFAASFRLAANPGEKFSYSSGTAVLLSHVFMNAVGDRWRALSFPTTALFAPLGMRSAVMETDETGIFAGSSYMYATARDWARFAQLLLNDGQWNGERLLPEGYVAAMGTPTPASDGAYSHAQSWIHGPGDVPNAQYGLPEDTFWMLGHDGQSIAVIRSRKLAVVRLGLTPSALGYRSQELVERIVDALDRGT